jgi:carboxyl-terminal processing protease
VAAAFNRTWRPELVAFVGECATLCHKFVLSPSSKIEQLRKNCMRFIALLLVGEIAGLVAVGADLPAQPLITTRHTNITALIEGVQDSNIVRMVGQILRRQHYVKVPFNDDLSEKFFDRYVDSLDNQRIFFLQSDLEEFAKYRDQLDDMVADTGDSSPARLIFNRFRERLDQQYDYAMELLKTEKFEFNGEDRFALDRKKGARPRDLDEARQLWRDRLRYEYLQEKLNKEKPDEIVKSLTRRYNRILRAIHDWDNNDVMQVYLTALAHVYDPHSDYMGKDELENFSIGMKLSLFGIGALLQSEDGTCTIKSLTPGGPAERSKKLKPNDKIVAVAQGTNAPVDVVDMKLNKVVELIRGAKGSEVRLTVVPADAPDRSTRKIISIVREEIKLEDQAAKAKIFDLPNGTDAHGNEQTIRVGYIDLPSFYSGFELEGRRGSSEQKSTTADVAKLLRKLAQEKVGGVILDLRRNGGGSLEEAINLTGLFIKEGPVVQVRDPSGQVVADEDTDPAVWYDGPLIVLTSRFSASASEILAGALQDYGRALLVGDSTTHGKGTVQSLLQLRPFFRQSGIVTTNDPGALKITIRKFYRASGASTQLKGVTPDIILPSVNDTLEVGESSLDNPLAWDTIEPAKYDKLNRVEPYLPDLKKRSDQRLATDLDFAYLREEIERFKKARAEKSVSLNEAFRLKEKQEADDRIKARKKELASRHDPPSKVYDITLKLADEPGLPPPTVRTNTTSAIKTNDAKTLVIAKDTNAELGHATSASGIAATAAGDDDAEPDVAPVDISLEEVKRILIDYIGLLKKANGVALTRPNQR